MDRLSTYSIAEYLDATPDAVVCVDSSGKIGLANAKAERLFGYREDELIGQPVEILVPSQAREHHRLLRERYSVDPKPRPMRSGRSEFVGCRRDGTTFPADVSLGIFEGGTLVMAVVRDVTERKVLTERLAVHDQTRRAQDEFVATVSHDLRTPLTAISGWVNILLGGEPGPLTRDQRRFLSTVDRNCRRLTTMVGNLLTAGQLDSGTLALDTTDVDMSDLARETMSRLSAQASAGHVEIALDAPEPVSVGGDKDKLSKVVENLLANAIKFTPGGGRVDLRVERRDGQCRVTVSDTGIGIPAEDRTKVFDRFFRASSAVSSGISGTGVGLAICQAIAERHDGAVYLAEKEGPGTVFVLELPSRPGKEPPHD